MGDDDNVTQGKSLNEAETFPFYFRAQPSANEI